MVHAPFGFRPVRHALAGALLSGALLAGVLPSAAAATSGTALPTATTTVMSTTTATTATSMQSSLVRWVNQARIGRGLRALRGWSPVYELAAYRAGRMAATGILSHSIGGDLGSELTARGIQRYSFGEAIGWTTATWGSSAAWSIYTMWRASATHWAILMSSHLNYIGVGFAYRSSQHATYASLIETESPDHTAPVRSFTGAWRSGTTIGWSWTGHDIALQTHTSGLENFDVNERRDGGSWVRLRSGTTSRSIALSGRAHGHTYTLAVRARDNRGNVSAWVYRSISVP